MPWQSVWFVKASLACLAVGFTFGALMLANKGVLISPFLFSLLPAHMEFLLIGWLVQLAMGVVFWIVPRFSGAKLRGNVHIDWLTFAGRSMEGTAVIGFGIGTWKRIKPHG